jgi:uncharacterized protein (DUF2252 family)
LAYSESKPDSANQLRTLCTNAQGNYSKKLDAPSWLWASVVDLVARHETAYLEHCRSYALEAFQNNRVH